MPDAIGEILEEEIIQKILDTVLEMCIGSVDIIYLKYCAEQYCILIPAIIRESTIYRRRQRLTALANGLCLGGPCKATLRRVKPQDMEKARPGMAVPI